MTSNDVLRYNVAKQIAKAYLKKFPMLTFTDIEMHANSLLMCLEGGLQTHVILGITGSLNENILVYKVKLP